MHVEHLAQDKYITAVVLLVGAPPPPPDNEDLAEFGSYIHALGVWTTQAREELFKFWGINDRVYESNVIFRKAFDRCIEKWYTLKYEEPDDDQR